MRDYSKVSPALWHSARFNSLPSDDGRFLLLYLITNEHQNSAGCYRLPEGYACPICAGLPRATSRPERSWRRPTSSPFDPECNVVMVRRWFRHNPPMNEDHYTGICRVLERLPSERIAEAALEALQEAWESIQAERQRRPQRSKPPPTGLQKALEAIADRLPSICCPNVPTDEGGDTVSGQCRDTETETGDWRLETGDRTKREKETERENSTSETRCAVLRILQRLHPAQPSIGS